MNARICPILSSKNEKEQKEKCIGSECSWWDDAEKCCVVWSMLKSTQQISDYGMTSLDDIYRTIKE